MRRAFFYGWVVVAVTAIVVLVTAGVRAAPGAFMLTMTSEPGWSTASVSFAAAAGLTVYGFAGPLVADRFGRHNVGIVYGWVFAAHMVGAAIAAWVAGIVREHVGDYAAAFVAAGWIAIVAGLAAMMIRRRDTDAEPPTVAPIPA